MKQQQTKAGFNLNNFRPEKQLLLHLPSCWAGLGLSELKQWMRMGKGTRISEASVTKQNFHYVCLSKNTPGIWSRESGKISRVGSTAQQLS